MITGVVFMLFMLFGFPLGIYFFIKVKTIGKMGVFMLEKDKHVVFSLKKVKGSFWREGGETFLVNPKRVRLLRYPFGWPSFAQQVIPCALYQREVIEPLDLIDPIDWINLSSSKVSPREVGTFMDPEILPHLVGAAGGVPQKQNKFQKMFPLLVTGICVVILLFLFYLLAQIGNLSGQVDEVHRLQQISSIYLGVS